MPKSEQIEYKNLVKRMAELEKIKQARQSSMNLQTKMTAPLKDTLKQRNATIDSTKLSALNSLEEKIKTSRYTFYFGFFILFCFKLCDWVLILQKKYC